MAATVSSNHQLHFQIEQQPSPPSPPKSTSSSASSSSSSSSSFLNSTELTPSSTDNYCKECEIMFESSASLEVHRSYHKENLLRVWANQESSNNVNSSEKSVVSNPTTSPSSSSEPIIIQDMSTSGSSSNSHPPTPHSIDGNAGSSSSISQQQRFFPNGNNEQNQSQFPQYGSNTPTGEQDQHAYRQQSMNNFNQPPPVDLNSHVNGSISHHPPYHSPIMIAQNHIFSPNHTVIPPNNHHPHPLPPEQHRGQPTNTEQGTAAAIRESAEILDLDSHKVHVYQPPIPADRHFFHSPYGLPPMFGNGWAHGIPSEHQFPHGHHHPPPPPSHSGFSEHLPPYSIHGQNPPGHPPPPPHQQPPTSVYDIDRGNPQFSTEPPQMDYPPTSQIPSSTQQQPPISVQNQGGPPPFGQPNGGPGFTPMAAQAADNRQERISLNSPLAPSPAQKSPNEATTPTGSAAAAVAKTKGWKGGECKRPKTYNCTACNKWFTSSGHLKRHYGTTLHKNSIKQKDLPEEMPPVPKRSKNGAKAAAAAAAAANSNNTTTDLIRDRSSMKDFGLKGSDVVGNGRSGYGPSPPVLPNSSAPPKISPHRHLEESDKNKPTGHMIGSSPAFNIPSGFKAFEPQALNAEGNSTIEHPSNSAFSQQQRLFAPAMSHHQPFYPMSHPPPPFMNGFAPESALQPGPPPTSSQYAG